MDIQDYDTLLKTLATIYPIQSKLLAKLKEFYHFKYQKKTTTYQYLNDYKILCKEIEQEQFIWKCIGEQGRASEHQH